MSSQEPANRQERARSADEFAWPPQSATGVGSMPGTDPVEAIAVVLGELTNLPFLPELPMRGPGADLVGRTAALLVDLPVETTATGWRLAERRGHDLGQAVGLLESDLDATEAAAAGYSGAFKIQVCGPWTLAASLRLTRSVEPALADPGAVADLIASLAEGTAAHVADVRRRLPGARVIVQFDEPALRAVLAGALPTASGLRRIPAVDAQDAEEGLGSVLAGAQAPAVIRCPAAGVPFGVLARAGARAVSFDLGSLRREQEDEIGEMAEAGLGLAVGAVPAIGQQDALAGGNGRQPGAREVGETVIGLWRRIGLPPASLAGQVVITPACGLAAASPEQARAVLALCEEAARLIPELIEEGAR